MMTENKEQRGNRGEKHTKQTHSQNDETETREREKTTGTSVSKELVGGRRIVDLVDEYTPIQQLREDGETDGNRENQRTRERTDTKDKGKTDEQKERGPETKCDRAI